MNAPPIRPVATTDEELYQIAGDQDHGFAADMNLTKTAEARVRVYYKNLVMDGELYDYGASKKLQLCCPRCTHTITIDTARKDIRYDARTGRLDVERFVCPWELEDRRMHHGIGLCKLALIIENNVARDAG